MTIPLEVDRLLSEKRFRKAQRRRWRDERDQARLDLRRPGPPRPSRLITMLATCTPGPILEPKRKLILRVPNGFSIIESPKEVLDVISTFAKSIRSRRLYRVTFDHHLMREYDLAAEVLMDLVAVELRSETRNHRKKTRFHGLYPRDRGATRFIKSMGIIKHLEIKHEHPEKHDVERIRVFEHRNRDYSVEKRPERADLKTRVLSRFVDHIDQCLADNGRRLTPQGKHQLGAYSGEILGNAEEHSGTYEWTIAGYLDNGLHQPICEITIFNFGRTIAESLNQLDPASYTHTQIAPYIERHRSSNWFQPEWREEDLLTLVALQGHISSKNERQEDHRGQGTVELIEFFQRVNNECRGQESDVAAKMAILSGSTHILFDGKYSMALDEAGRYRIAFNDANDLHQKPDHRYVKGLGDYFFPGTVISIRFPLQTTSTFASVAKKGAHA